MQAFRVQLTDLLAIPSALAAVLLPCTTALLSSWPAAIPSLRLRPSCTTEALRHVPSCSTSEAVTDLEASQEPVAASHAVPYLHQQLQHLCAAEGDACPMQNDSQAAVSMEEGWRTQDPSELQVKWMQMVGRRQWAWLDSSLAC